MRPHASLLLWCSGLAWVLVAEAASQDLGAQLARRTAAIFEEFQTAYQRAIHQVDQRLGIDYRALDGRFGASYREWREKRAIIASMHDEAARQQARQRLDGIFHTPEALQYLEGRLVLENLLESDHRLKARRLQGCDEILEALIASDPLFRYFFHSPEYQRRYGLLLKRVVWASAEGTSAATRPLETYTMFADRRRLPILIMITPAAFKSLPFLRSILIHELNHVVLYKEPLGAVSEPIASDAGALPSPPPATPYSRSFMKRHGGSNDYQQHLIHEYYAFTAQLLYDDRAASDSQQPLAPEDRWHIEHLRQWTFQQLSPPARAFVQQHPEPPVMAYVSGKKLAREPHTAAADR